MSESISYAGMDVHKNSVKICLLPPGGGEPVQWQERHTPQAIRRLSRRLLRESGGDLLCCYEAGPTGYGLLRQLEGAGIPCPVIAPSLTPVRPGSRVKTDRRDARKLPGAALHRHARLRLPPCRHVPGRVHCGSEDR